MEYVSIRGSGKLVGAELGELDIDATKFLIHS